MSVPPDNFDDGEPPDEPPNEDEYSDQEFVAWRGMDDPPEWFYSAGDILGDLEERSAVNLNIDPYTSDFATGNIVLHGYDEDTGEDLYWAKDWTKDEWMDFYYYTMDYYDEGAFWAEHYTPDML